MPTEEDFANAPRSLAEVRAERAGKASVWSPRDMLVYLLREIDAGRFAPTAMVCAFGSGDDPALPDVGYQAAGCGTVIAMGLLAAASHQIWGGRHE